MLGLIGKALISASFIFSLLAAIVYFLSARKEDNRLYVLGNTLFALKTVFITVASVILVFLLVQHQFQYYYVFNYSSIDMPLKYLISAFYGGQEGSFMLWIAISGFIGLGLMKWTKAPYKAPVLFFMTFTQVFLISMIVGWDFGDLRIGASPFRTLAYEMPNAPFLQSNPDFIPTDGKGLNDLLKSPWMMIHPPMLFVGFAMMTVPFCFAMAALWKGKYVDWVKPALPWTLMANVMLLTAIFLGGYWAYVTLSFGGYWAWDPVENASLVPWLIGAAGIHAMVITNKSGRNQKTAILFAILSYIAIVYETFLTRSGVLSDSSVHSFVDLGLFNQLLIFMATMIILGLGMFVARLKDFPKASKNKNQGFFSGEFMTFMGSMLLFLLGFVIVTGTSSPILGKLFVSNPTPPDISFYNNWTMPIVMIMAVFTVLGQMVFWKRQNVDSLSMELIVPVILAAVATMASIYFAQTRHIYYILYIFVGWFALFGNGKVLYSHIKKDPKRTGGVITHLGFAILLLGIIASSAFNDILIDERVAAYNQRVEEGGVIDDNGVPVTEPVNFLELYLNQPKVIGNKYIATYEGYDLTQISRPGEQSYRIKLQPIDAQESESIVVNPVVYPMRPGANATSINWSVDPDVSTGWAKDIFIYVAGSSYVDRRNKLFEKDLLSRGVAQSEIGMDHDHDGDGVPDHGVGSDAHRANEEAVNDSLNTQTLSFTLNEHLAVGGFTFHFNEFIYPSPDELPDSTIIGVRADITVGREGGTDSQTIQPLFVLVNKENSTWAYSPPIEIPDWGLTFSFEQVKPESSQIEIQVKGLSEKYEPEWILLVAENKPFISVVWLGTFLLMGGMSISIFRRWAEVKKYEKIASM
jgi:cytochrome c-type biogenesis protein CcmF